MLDSVHAMHGRFMISVWPKFYCNTDNYKELDAKGWMYVQSPTDDIHDWVGPGYKNGFYDAYDAGPMMPVRVRCSGARWTRTSILNIIKKV